MDQRISLVTLGMRDVGAATRFYETIGWTQTQSPDGVVVFDLLGQTLGLYPLDALAEDIGVPVEELGRGASTLGCNTRTKEEVADILGRVEPAGGKVLKPASDVFWGGHHGYFADPEGHIWEVAWNPFSPLREEDGAFRWNGYG